MEIKTATLTLSSRAANRFCESYSRNKLTLVASADSVQSVCSGRDDSESVARLWDFRPCDVTVAGFVYFFSNGLLRSRYNYVFARISKCRCAKNQRDRRADASERPTA